MIGLCLLFSLPLIHSYGSIRYLLSSRAVVVSLLDEVSSELFDRPLILREVSGIFNNHIDYFYIGCVISSISYFTFQRMNTYSYFIKLNDLFVYRDTYRKFRMILFIIVLLCMRDIENAI
jgi:hypothetical protein